MSFCFRFIFSYDLDPDDGYGALLPYDSYYTKDYKNVPHIQTTVQPTYLQKPTAKPLNNDYDFNAEPISGFQPYNPYDPYEQSVTTLDTHQHLTETTPIEQPSYRNRTTVQLKPLSYDNFIPTSSSKPIQDVLNNLNRTSLQLLLTKLKEDNYLPKTFTMNKLDNSLRTLAKVLVDLKKSPKPIKTNEYAQLPVVDHSPKIQAIKSSYENVKPIKGMHNNNIIKPASILIKFISTNSPINLTPYILQFKCY